MQVLAAAINMTMTSVFVLSFAGCMLVLVVEVLVKGLASVGVDGSPPACCWEFRVCQTTLHLGPTPRL